MLGIWFLLNDSLSGEIFVSGLILSLFLALWSSKFFPVFKHVSLTPKSLWAFLRFTGVFLAELIRANVDVALRVLSPSLPIKPGIVAVKTRLKDPLARLMLANAITLTPGTFTLDIRDDILYIHWIDAGDVHDNLETDAIVQKFEKHLEALFDR
jgi:multicomponent Na+:H+ antiporter subunit E